MWFNLSRSCNQFWPWSNNVETGFYYLNSLDNNIKNFSPYVSKIIVIKQKINDFYYKYKDLDKVELIKNEIPEKDPNHQFKQFFSTYSGAKYLSKESNITLVLKIKTDQLVDPKILE